MHRGIAEEYRGLDSDVWAIYNNDFKNIGVTIHRVEEELDTGDILKCKKLQIKEGMKVHELRYYTTVLASNLALELMREYQQNGKLVTDKQKKRGKYYSFAPLELKKAAALRFNTFTEKASFQSRLKKDLCILLYHGVTKAKTEGIENYSHKHCGSIYAVL